jgi:oxygen-independent coproporphyrinogen-3 oxidase
MAGIYIHIPFCRQACNYCNFYFSTSIAKKGQFLEALLKEIVIQKYYLEEKDHKKTLINSIYFGGGTPSLLTARELTMLFEALYKNYNISEDAEITLEANPDDLTFEMLTALRATPVNRLSIGIQSFIEEDLRFMNRAHTAEQGMNSIKMAKELGFENLTIDLIYGTPTLTIDNWERNLEKVFSCDIPHLSCYCLTIEEKTALAYLVQTKKVPDVDEEKAIKQFEILLSEIAGHGYVQYEISNFCKDGKYSLHNSNYWRKEKYLGLGPSAHSFDGFSRQWNVANNNQYITSVNNDNLDFEREVLTDAQRFNEYILTSLRTIWGTDLEKVKTEFGEACYVVFRAGIAKFTAEGALIEKEGVLYLTNKGKLLADKITSDLFM